MTCRYGQLVWFLAATCVVVASGCASQSPRIASSAAVLPAGESSAAFMDRVSALPTVSENDAMRGILLLIDGKDQAENFQQRIDALSKRGILPKGCSFAAGKAITNGKLAYMVYQACKIRGGATLTLFGPSQWYCLRELQYQRFITHGGVLGVVAGMEFVAVVGRADAYLQTGEVPEELRAGL